MLSSSKHAVEFFNGLLTLSHPSFAKATEDKPGEGNVEAKRFGLELTSETPIGAIRVNNIDLDKLTGHLRQRVEVWALQWGTAGLERRLRIEWSSRLRVALGRARPADKLIRINAALADQPFPLLEEIVCHEAAHVAVHELYRGRRRPHGPEWRDLMRRAGFEPRVRMPLQLPPTRGRPQFVWDHRCPVCQAHRVARRPVYRWRCAACIDAGQSGHLTIARRAASPPQLPEQQRLSR